MSTELLGRMLADPWPNGIDYQSEVDIVAEIGKEHGPIASVLGFGDGNRRHLDLFSAAGYDTAGEPGERLFDAVLMMGSTIGRQVGDEALAATLATAGNRLHPGGLIVFDILDGNVVYRQEPRSMFTRTVDGTTQFVQSIIADVDSDTSVLGLHVKLWRMDGETVADQLDESWSIRFFLPRELELVLAINGFDLLGTCALPAEHHRVGGWHRLAWARKPMRA